jgi:type I restriction enzyme R subunit
MSTVGQIEKMTQERLIALFVGVLRYDYLGNWIDREDNRNIEEQALAAFLKGKGYEPRLVQAAIHELKTVAGDLSMGLYQANKAVYGLLRYGVKVKAGIGEQYETVWLVDWKNPLENDFGIAEEVAIHAADPKANGKRPDLVLFVNGIALGVIELKRSTVSVAQGIRQNLDNQKKEFIQPFFSTMQYVMAGNDTEGLRYGTIQTPEKYYLTWKEPGDLEKLLDRAVVQLCEKERFLELIHDFIVYDAGTKKLSRHNQYFGVKAAQTFVRRREGGILWHTQGSGKSLIMVWLAKWIREHVKDARVLIITDRTELDEQIEKVFKGVEEDIQRTKSGADLLAKLSTPNPWLIGSLIHKFGTKEEGEEVGDLQAYVEDLKKALARNFQPMGDLYVFVDECHRTQTGELHKAMKAILPNALFLGFTGTPLLKADKQKSIEVFGRYIHTYKFDEAVRDKVILDLRYEARDIDQKITSQAKIDQWFEAKTKGLTDVAKAQLKQRWGTLKNLLSCQDRLEKIVADILLDMSIKPRLADGHGNAMLVSGSIYQACKFYELFSKTELKGKCAIVTSYAPTPADIKGEETGEGLTEKLHQYDIYKQMLADWFNEEPEKAVSKAELFEKQVKKQFIDEPGQMKLLIVVDKLLTGFDAPSATYLYIDKQMRDHGLFQAICRVNRLDGDDKDYGYIIDYKDLFQSLEGAVHDYTSEAFDAYDKDDVAGLLKDRLKMAKEALEEAREAVKALCEPVEPPRDSSAFMHYFCAKESGNGEQLKANEPKRVALYKLTATLLRTYAELASDLEEAGYLPDAIQALKQEVDLYQKVRDEVKLASGDYIDLKMFEPAMRHLIDTYIRAEESEKISAFDDVSLVQLIVERGVDALKALPKGLQANHDSAAETIENNVRKLIIDEQPVNPKYYEEMSKLLEALIDQRRKAAITYKEYLAQVVVLTRMAKNPGGASYPSPLDTPAKRSLYDNLYKDEVKALRVHEAVIAYRQDDWRHNTFKVRRVRIGIREALAGDDAETDRILELVKNQREY